MRQIYPLTFGVIEDIKRDDHRNFSKQVQAFTAEVIRLALLDLQTADIAAIPDVDAIFCRQKHRKEVCRVIGEKMYAVSGGVRCKVDGIRYNPPAAD